MQTDDLDRTLPSPAPGKPASSPSSAKKWQPPAPEELQGVLSQYRITRLLGRGGMGAVYEGVQINLERPVAIKILPPDLGELDDDAQYAARFKNEARAMARLSHPGIVGVFDFGETPNGLLYIVMEFIEGTDVQKMVSQQGRLHTEHALAITAHVCDALHYAHEQGIIHRDIKPANIMVGYDGVVKVADFGLAKMDRAGESGLTRSGMAMGTLHYMAPEALMLGSSVDQRADLYAVGVMLYFMLTGKLPQGLFELPSLQIPGLDPRFDGIIAKALRDDRDIRHQSAAELRHDLDSILTQPVVQVTADDDQAPAAVPTEARPQQPAGHYFRPPPARVEVRVEKRGSPLLWVVLAVMSGLMAWLWLEKQPETKSSQTITQSDADKMPAAAPLNLEAAKSAQAAVGSKEADLPVTQSVSSGIWHDMLAEKILDTSGLQRTADSGPAEPHYLVTSSSMHKITPHVFRDCILRARFSGEWQSEPVLFLRCILSNTVFESMSAKFEGHTVRLNRHYFPPKSIKILSSTAMVTPLARNKSVVVELKVVGDKYTLLRDGAIISETVDPAYATGHAGIWLPPGTVIEKLEIMPLAVVEVSAHPPGKERQLAPAVIAAARTQTLNTSPVAPAAGTTTSELAHGEWHDLFEKKLITTAGLVREADGSYRATSIVTSTSLPVFKNCVIRAKFGPGTWSGVPQLIIRREAPSGARYVSATCFDYKAFLRNHQSGYKVFATGNMETSLLREQSFDLELQAMGDHFTFRKDGSDLVSGNMSGYDRGHVGFRFEVGTIVKSLEVMPLDGLTPEQQKAALNASKSTDSKHPPPDVSSSSAAAPSPAVASPTPKAAMPVATAPLSTAPNSTSNSAFPPSWTDRNGRRITAEFVRADANMVTLKMQNGTETSFPLNRLSVESRKQAAQLVTDSNTFTNSLGMKFVPVPGTQMLFCVHETRRRDYAAFARETRALSTWDNLTYAGHTITTRAEDHPVTNISVKQAMLFCEWLGKKENKKYRLPTSEEWTLAVKSDGKDDFPWGNAWPPPQGAGNYCDESYHRLRPADPYLRSYDDRFPTTAPVMSFPPNTLGIHDLGGNVWEWVHAGDPTNATTQNNPPMVQRGASFLHDSRDFLRSRKEAPSTSTAPDAGFRVMLEPSHLSAGLTTAPARATPSQATKDTPYINSMGMKFVPVPGTKVLMSIYETRVRDFRMFVKTAQYDYKKGPSTFYGGREQPELDWEYQVPNKPPVGDDHPVQHVSWEDAQAFNQWITRHELDAGHLPPGHSYRLPTSAEWSSATGPGPYGWGSEWPPPPKAGNFTNNASQTAGDLPPFAWDTFSGSSPVGSFPPNRLGLFDLDGNSHELGAEVSMQNGARMVDARGTNFAASRNPRSLNINSHRSMSSDHRHVGQGFRCVLELPSSTP